MNNAAFDTEDIQDIAVEEYEKESFWVSFRMGGCSYEMAIKKNRDLKFNVYHQTYLDKAHCPFCSRGSNPCPGLMKYSKELFYHLTNHPNIRLHWVTSDHVFQSESEEVL